MGRNIMLFGSNGAIGRAFMDHYLKQEETIHLECFSRSEIKAVDPRVSAHKLDLQDEMAIEQLLCERARLRQWDRILVCSGVLHDQVIDKPEKSLRDLSSENLFHYFQINTIAPLLIAKHTLKHLRKDHLSVFGVLSARVGSISDNRLGGWYGYRSSKAALNMGLKCCAIEIARSHPKACVVGLHPGTVDSFLSKPFQNNIKKEKLFTPDYGVHCLDRVIENLTPMDSGKIYAWDGQEIHP